MHAYIIYTCLLQATKASNEAAFLKLFDTLDLFLRTATIGEFHTRLELVRLFACELTLHYTTSASDTAAHSTGDGEQHYTSYGLQCAHVLHGLWRYYQQVRAY